MFFVAEKASATPYPTRLKIAESLGKVLWLKELVDTKK